MIINGTITKVQPVDSTDQNNTQYQWVVIASQAGVETTGRIGSKQGYQAGMPINVTVEQKQGNDGVYNYFKKFNPQYGSPQQPSNFQKQLTPQNPPQAPSRPAGASKDRLIVAQVVYKATVGVWKSDLCAFDVWLMGDGKNVLKRHVDLIMLEGQRVKDPTGGTPVFGKPNPAESQKQAQDFEENVINQEPETPF